MYVDDFKRLGIWLPYTRVLEEDRIVEAPSLNGVNYAIWSKRSVLMAYDEAIQLAKSLTGLDGVGFVIPEGFAVLNLDECYDEANRLNSIANHQVYKFRSYTEKSLSCKGLHIIVKANLRGYSKNTFYIEGQSVEVLTPGNFVTYTGNSINVEFYGIDESTIIIQKMYVKHGKNVKMHNEMERDVDYLLGELHDCSYGKTVLKNECDNAKRATIGARTNALLKAAFIMGGLIPDGHISENEVFRELDAAGRSTGLNHMKVKRTIQDGLKYGKLHPRDVKCGAVLPQ